MKYFKKTQLYNEGFTLVETLVGIFIFLLAYMALASVNGSSLEDISITSRKLTAEYLAEEGVEYVKYVQKSYENDPNSMASFLADINSTTSGCTNTDPCDFYLNEGATEVSKGDSTLPLVQWPYGLIVSQSATYSPAVVTYPGYARRIYIDSISSNPLQSQALKVVSEVTYLPSQPPVRVTAIIHFNF